MLVQAVGLFLLAAGDGFAVWAVAMTTMGVGTALVYPTLLAAVGDEAHPTWRSSSVGVYRLWRDGGYAVGAVVAGLLADLFGMAPAITVVGVLTLLSGGTVATVMEESLREERERHGRTAESLLTAVDVVEEGPDGYRLRLPADGETIRKAAAFISRERLCCPFFDFTLEIGSDAGPVWLTLAGRSGVKSYLEETLIPQLGDA